uniref:exopolysaccharide biosynthesis polyprenyl glycosylphosphotransferase n=1 Tax=Eubacterium cellulosolvens TaxID=29322 RepID=UPI000684D624|nr:exopolysaccharide biosynthesis polyprenyl glycosylphosphotransferase [[Eubacterium] cellulosolvens]
MIKADLQKLNTRRAKKQSSSRYVFRTCCAIILTAMFSASFFYVWLEFVEEHNQTGHLLGLANLLMAVLIYGGISILLFNWLGGYRIGVYRKANIVASQISGLFLLNIAEIFVSMAITGQFRFFFDFLWRYALLFIVQAVADVVVTDIMVNVYRKMFPPFRLLEVYDKHEGYAKVLPHKLNSMQYKYHVAASIRSSVPEDELISEMLEYDAVLINDLPAEEEKTILKLCFAMNKRVYFVPKISDILVKSSGELNQFDSPLYYRRNLPMNFWERMWKRFFDVLLSALAILLLSPLFAAVAIAIRMEDGGSVFFRQERCTIGGKVFSILKFRSMIEDADKDGEVHPAEDEDPRITKVGRFIRKFRIDELPQLINILKGDMSIVGPRPERIEHIEKYTKDIPEFCFREKVKGGLTGYAQVYGKYNTSALDKLKMDIIYIVNYSVLLDIQIIFETVRVLFSKESTEGFGEEQSWYDNDASSEEHVEENP